MAKRVVPHINKQFDYSYRKTNDEGIFLKKLAQKASKKVFFPHPSALVPALSTLECLGPQVMHFKTFKQLHNLEGQLKALLKLAEMNKFIILPEAKEEYDKLQEKFSRLVYRKSCEMKEEKLMPEDNIDWLTWQFGKLEDLQYLLGGRLREQISYDLEMQAYILLDSLPSGFLPSLYDKGTKRKNISITDKITYLAAAIEQRRISRTYHDSVIITADSDFLTFPPVPLDSNFYSPSVYYAYERERVENSKDNASFIHSFSKFAHTKKQKQQMKRVA